MSYPSEDIAQDDAQHAHIAPISLYLKVFSALLFLTVLTVGVSYANLGSLSFPTAMLVALIKASLVAGFFMHLRYDDKIYSFVLVAAVFTVAIFFTFTYLDLFSRGDFSPAASNYELERDRAWQEQQLNAPVEAPAPETTAAPSAAAPVVP